MNRPDVSIVVSPGRVSLDDLAQVLAGAAVVLDPSFWPRVEAAVRDLCGDLSGPLLQQLDAIEDGLISTPLPRRASANKEKTP